MLTLQVSRVVVELLRQEDIGRHIIGVQVGAGARAADNCLFDIVGGHEIQMDRNIPHLKVPFSQ